MLSESIAVVLGVSAKHLQSCVLLLQEAITTKIITYFFIACAI